MQKRWIAVAALLSLSGGPQSVWAVDPPRNGLIGEYLFSEAVPGGVNSGTVVDTSGNGSNGSANGGGCLLGVPDRFNTNNTAWEFNSDRFGSECSFNNSIDPAEIVLPHLPITDSFSVAVWRGRVGGGSPPDLPITGGSGNLSSDSWILGQTDGQANGNSPPTAAWFRLVVGADPFGSNPPGQSSRVSLVIPAQGVCPGFALTDDETLTSSNTDEWRLYVASISYNATANETTATLYRGSRDPAGVELNPLNLIDVFSDTKTGRCANPSATDPIYLGSAAPDERLRILFGSLDDVRFYDRALGIDDVVNLFREREFVNQPPELLSGFADLSTPAGIPFVLRVSDFFNDPDNDPLTFEAVGLPPSLTLDDGVITGAPTAADLGAGPVYTVTVTARDDVGGAQSDEFDLTLSNMAPQFLPLPADQQVLVGDAISIDVAPLTVDPDGQPLNYSLTALDSGGQDVTSRFSILNSTTPGLITGQASPDLLVNPTVTINVTVRDQDQGGIDLGTQASASFDLTINDTAPVDLIFERFFPTLQQPWYFTRVSDVATTPDGTVYLADSARGRVLRFSKDGLLITQWGDLGNAPGTFVFLSLELAVSAAGEVFAASGPRLQRFGSNGQFLQQLDFGAGDEILDLTVDALDRLYLLFSDRVEIHSATSPGNNVEAVLHGLAAPTALAVGVDARLYVSDNATSISVFSPPAYDAPSATGVANAGVLAFDAEGRLNTVGAGDGVLRRYDPDLALLSQADVSPFAGANPIALAVSRDGLTFLSDGPSVFGIDEAATASTFTWRSASQAAGRFDGPLDITADDTGNLYVVEANTSRVQKFTSAGVLIDSWPLLAPVAAPETAQVYLLATSGASPHIWITTGDSLEVFDEGGTPLAPQPQIAGLDQPGPIAQTPAGRIVVADLASGSNEVLVTQLDGTVVEGPWDLTGCGPTDLSIGANNLLYFLCESGAPQLAVFTEAGQEINRFDLPSDADPRGLAVSDLGLAYVLETRSTVDPTFGVTRFDSELRIFSNTLGATANVDQTVGTGGYSAGRFNFVGPVAGIDLGPSDEIYLAEPGNNRVQTLTPSGLGRNTKAIVVAGGGDYPENYLWEATQINTNNAYDKLIYQGFTADQILYLHPDSSLDLDGNPLTLEVDGEPSIANLQAAFAPGGFAEDADNLVFYLADHGSADLFRVSPTEVVEASQVATWLADLQQNTWPARAVPPAGVNGWITVIYEACESGSFQDDLAPADGLAGNRRLVITTSNDGQNANFIAQGFLSFSYQFWINVFNGFDVRSAYDAAVLTVQETYEDQDPIFTLVDGGVIATDLDEYFTGGGQNFGFAARVIGNGTANAFSGPLIEDPVLPQNLGSSASGEVIVESISDPDGVARAWLVLQPPEYQVRDSFNPVLELPTVDLQPAPTGPLPNRYRATYNNFTTEGEYRIEILAQDTFGNVSQFSASDLTVTAGNPPKNKAILLVSGDSSDRGQAFLDNGDFAYQALLRQDFVNDLDPATPNVSNVADEIRYFTQGQFSGADVAQPTIAQLESLNGPFVDAMTQNIILYLAADFDPVRDGFVFPGLATIGVAELEAFLDEAEALLQGRATLVIEGENSGAVVARLVDSSPRRVVVSSGRLGQAGSLLEAGAVSFSKFFWNAVRDGFSVGTAYRLARNAIAGVNSEQQALLDANGNGIANEREDEAEARSVFLGPGISRAGNGPLVGGVQPDLVIDQEAVSFRAIRANDVSATSPLARVVGAVSVSGGGDELGTFDLAPVPSQPAARKGQAQINLGDFEGVFDGFDAAGDYDIAVFALDENGDPSAPQTATLRKTAGPDRYEPDDTPNTGTPTLLGAPQQRHTLQPLGSGDAAEDQDWLLLSLADEPARQARLTFSQLDAGLTLSVRVFPDARLSDASVDPVLDALVLPMGSVPQDVVLPDSLPGGRYLVRLAAALINPALREDPSVGYLVGLADPFADLEGELSGLVLDAASMVPLAAVVVGLDGTDEVGRTFSCFRNCGAAGGPGGFRLRLPQGSYSLRLLRPGYVTQDLGTFSVRPNAVTPVPTILLNPEGSATAPSVTGAAASAEGETVIRVSASVNANGSEANVGVLVARPGEPVQAAAAQALVTGNSAQLLELPVSGLDCETTYEFTVRATSAGGTADATVVSASTGTCTSAQIFADSFEG